MWFTRRAKRRVVRGVRAVDLFATIASPDSVPSPVSARRAAIVRIEVFEKSESVAWRPADWISLAASGADLSAFDTEGRDYLLGDVTLGDDLLLLADDGAVITVSTPHARLVFRASAASSYSLDEIPAALAARCRARSTDRDLACRELRFGQGERVRLRAFVERVTTSPAGVDGPYRSSDRVAFVARPDCGPVTIVAA